MSDDLARLIRCGLVLFLSMADFDAMINEAWSEGAIPLFLLSLPGDEEDSDGWRR